MSSSRLLEHDEREALEIGEAEAEPEEQQPVGLLPVERLLCMTDGMFSIFATIMAAPIGQGDEESSETGEPLSTIAKFVEAVSQISSFLCTFMMLYQMWLKHSVFFSRVEAVPLSAVLLNLLLLVIVGLFPASFAVLTAKHQADVVAAASIFAGLYVLIQFCYVAMVFCIANDHSRVERARIISQAFTGCAAMGVGVFGVYILCAVKPDAGSFSLPILVCALLLFARVHKWAFEKWYRTQIAEESLVGRKYRNPLPKSRFEAFADGVYTIAATLIALDLQPTNVTSIEDAFTRYGHDMLASCVAVVLVLMMWTNHYTVSSYIRVASSSLVSCNCYLCILVGIVPYCLSTAIDTREAFSIMVFGIAVTLCGLTFVVMLWLARTAKDETGKRNIWATEQPEVMPYLKAQFAVLPLTGLLIVVCSFIPGAESLWPGLVIPAGFIFLSALSHRRFAQHKAK